jgi:hypothetical protein
MVTFKLSVFKIMKNSLIFVLLGLKRNIVALLGVLLLVLVELLCLLGLGGILLPVAVALPLVFLMSGSAYMKVFAAYYKIKEVMIDPYKAEHPDEEEEHVDDEPVMIDDVTEAERLREIKIRNGIPLDEDE